MLAVEPTDAEVIPDVLDWNDATERGEPSIPSPCEEVGETAVGTTLLKPRGLTGLAIRASGSAISSSQPWSFCSAEPTSSGCTPS